MGQDCSGYSRNVPLGFACRVRRNLHYILERAPEATGVHHVTQIVISTLGLIVFPWEKEGLAIKEALRGWTVEEFSKRAGAEWRIRRMPGGEVDDEYGTTSMVGFLRHLRNAVAHGDFRFSGDQRDPELVSITFSFRPRRNARIDREAAISASDLRGFCERFVDVVLGTEQGRLSQSTE